MTARGCSRRGPNLASRVIVTDVHRHTTGLEAPDDHVGAEGIMHDERDTALAAIPTIQSRSSRWTPNPRLPRKFAKPVSSNSGLRRSALPVPANGHQTIEEAMGDRVKYSTQRPFGHRRHLSAPTSPTHSFISRRPALRRPRSCVWPMPAQRQGMPSATTGHTWQVRVNSFTTSPRHEIYSCRGGWTRRTYPRLAAWRPCIAAARKQDSTRAPSPARGR